MRVQSDSQPPLAMVEFCSISYGDLLRQPNYPTVYIRVYGKGCGFAAVQLTTGQVCTFGREESVIKVLSKPLQVQDT
jgi:hypothetical protein